MAEDREHFYHYDCEGNLVFKEFRTLDWAGVSVPLGVQKAHLEEELGITFRAFGAGWRYDWQSDGMLSRVVRPDGKEVSFAYDALGRRTEKTYEGVTTHFVWDGNVPLHEWQEVSSDTEKTNITTWLFEQDTFIPAAKLAANGESFSIVSDYLGTPLQAFDNNGNKVWEQELDIFGRKRTGNNNSSFIPFKYQGQYEDVETGLYYNRFRYYDPNTGTYISKNPIGLAGNNPTLYGYVGDCNKWFDLFGLDYFYQLIKHDKVVYNGITKNPVKDRIADHIGVKDFTEFRYVQVKDRIASRNLEGSALHNADGKGLQNAHRKDGQYYHSYDPDDLAAGRTYYTQAEIDEIMKKAETGEIKDGKVILHNCK